ncbi:MAG: hypothetical protein KAR40_08860 [Candidatus Sabulitectum sp.]|nr:hypothetical protein [Candidatus Sabulitectum sp.]
MPKVFVVTVLVILLFMVACTKDPLSPTLTVEYKVTGTVETADIDYIDANGKLAIINNVKIPWSLSFTADRGHAVFLSAKNTGTAGTVAVAIYSDGNVLDEDTSTGSGAATAEGTI